MRPRLTTSKLFLKIGLTGVLVFMASCALLGGGGDPITHAQGIHVSAPARWKAIDSGDSDHAYRLPSGAVATLTSSCKPVPKQSLELMTRHLLMGERGTTYAKRERMTVDGSEGLFSDVQTYLEDKRFYLNLFVLPKQGCIFDFTLVSPKTIAKDETDEFLTFVKSFRYGKG